jgi:hypothetical protein
VWKPPAAISTALVIPATVTTDELVVLAPSPSCPSVPLPQHLTVPSPIKAQVWNAPVDTCVASLTPTTMTAVLESTVVPLPS